MTRARAGSHRDSLKAKRNQKLRAKYVIEHASGPRYADWDEYFDWPSSDREFNYSSQVKRRRLAEGCFTSGFPRADRRPRGPPEHAAAPPETIR